MRRLKRLRFSSRVCVIIVVAWIVGLELGGAGFAMWRWRQASRERRDLEVRREVLAPGLSVLSVESVNEAETERARAEAARQAWRAECGVRSASSAPTSRSRAFFEITGWIEDLRAVARDHGVVCREDERFGFASYARQGPSLDVLFRVHRQREAAGALLESLFAVRPHGFERLQREDPLPAVGRTAGGKAEADYFAFVDESSLIMPAETAAEAFRITFVGHTRAVRQWLNHLAAMPGPVVVHDLQVEPVSTEGAEPDAVRFTIAVQVLFLDLPGTALTTEAAVTQVSR